MLEQEMKGNEASQTGSDPKQPNGEQGAPRVTCFLRGIIVLAFLPFLWFLYGEIGGAGECLTSSWMDKAECFSDWPIASSVAMGLGAVLALSGVFSLAAAFMSQRVRRLALVFTWGVVALHGLAMAAFGMRFFVTVGIPMVFFAVVNMFPKVNRWLPKWI